MAVSLVSKLGAPGAAARGSACARSANNLPEEAKEGEADEGFRATPGTEEELTGHHKQLYIRKSNACYFGNLSIGLPFGFHNPGIRARGGKKSARQPGVLWKWVRGRQRGGEQKLPALSDLLPLPNFSTTQATITSPQQPSLAFPPPMSQKLLSNM